MSQSADFSNSTTGQTSWTDAEILVCFQKVATQALLRHALPTEIGGLGDGFSSLIEAHRQLGAATLSPGFILTVNAHLWGAVFPIWLYGNASQQQFFLPKLLSGDWLAGHAITEPDCGSDVQAMTSWAEVTANGYRLHGEKRYITNVSNADWLVIYAKLAGKISGFLVSRNDPGCEFSQSSLVNACQGSSTGSIFLDRCELDKNRLLGKSGAGAQMIQKALEYERAFVFAGMAGVMQWQLDEVVRYSRLRQSGGVHLGKHQAIGHRIAEMKLRLDTINLWLNECARLADSGQRLTLASAQTKLYAAEAFLQSSLDAVQILGAAGLMTGSIMPGLVQDAMAGRLFSGSSEIQKNLVASLLGTGDGFLGKARA